jgi:hypothetical protein
MQRKTKIRVGTLLAVLAAVIAGLVVTAIHDSQTSRAVNLKVNIKVPTDYNPNAKQFCGTLATKWSSQPAGLQGMVSAVKQHASQETLLPLKLVVINAPTEQLHIDMLNIYKEVLKQHYDSTEVTSAVAAVTAQQKIVCGV